MNFAPSANVTRILIKTTACFSRMWDTNTKTNSLRQISLGRLVNVPARLACSLERTLSDAIDPTMFEVHLFPAYSFMLTRTNGPLVAL